MRKILILTGILVICIFFDALAQSPEVDSLKSELLHAEQDTSRLSLLNQLCKAYWYVKPDESIEIGKKAYQLAERLDDKKGLATALFNLGIGYWVQSKYDTALVKITQSLSISESIADIEGIAHAYNGLGIIHRNKGNYVLALDYQHKNLKINQKAKNQRGIAIAYTNIAVIHYSQGNLVKALDYNLKALKIHESIGNKLELAGAYNNIGLIYRDEGNYEEALDYYQRAIKLQQEINDRKGIAHSYVNIGNILAEQSKDTLALINFSKAQKIYEELGDQQGLAATSTNIGDIYYGQGSYQLAQEKYFDALGLLKKIGYQQGTALTLNAIAKTYFTMKEYALSVKYAEESMGVARDMQAKNYLKDAAETLYKSYQQLGNYEEAFHHHVLFEQYKDSLINEENIKKIEEIKFDNEIEKKETENALLRTQNEWQARQVTFQKTLKNVFIIGSILLLGLVFVFIRGRQKEKKTSQLLYQKNKEISAIARDLTAANVEIKAQKQNLEKLNQSKDKLFSVISHDLRSPLNSLYGLLVLLQEERLSQNEIQQILPEITQQLYHSQHLLDNLLVWAKSQMQGLGPHPQKVNLQEVTEETIQLLQSSAEYKGIQLKNDIHGTVEVFTDQDMIKLVLRNLVANAIKFTPTGGEVMISAKVESAGFVQVEVSDTGVGIGEEEQRKLFKETIYSTRGTQGEKGTGLGLLLSKDFVESNGGAIWVRSTKGMGSTFIFTVPVTERA